jgi:hypothetical protein
LKGYANRLRMGVAGGTAAVGGATIGINSIGLILFVYFYLYFIYIVKKKEEIK